MAEEKLCPISIEYFAEKRKFEVDVFIKLSADKFVLFGREGQIFGDEHSEKFKQKSLEYFFIRAVDFGKLADQAVTVAGIAISQKNIASSFKIMALENACVSLFNEIKAVGFDERALGHAQTVSLVTMNLISKVPNLADLVERLIKNSVRDERHSLMVSAMASMLGIAMGWTRHATLERLALGGLLHDVGKLNLPPDILAKGFEDLNKDEKIIYKSHCEFGRETLAKMRLIPDDVRLMVFEHHELADGSGYPRGIKDLLISPYGRVMSLANAFTESVLSLGPVVSTSNIKSAFDKMNGDHSAQFNKDCLKALSTVIGREWKKEAV